MTQIMHPVHAYDALRGAVSRLQAVRMEMADNGQTEEIRAIEEQIDEARKALSVFAESAVDLFIDQEPDPKKRQHFKNFVAAQRNPWNVHVQSHSEASGFIQLIDEAQKTGPYQFLPPHLVIREITDDSMEPTFRKGDLVVIDSEQRFLVDGFYALQYGNSVAVRRLHLQVAGGVKLLTDNKSYQDELIEETAQVASMVIGRVVMVEKRL